MAMEKHSKRTRHALKAIEDAVFFLLGEKEFESVTAQDIYRQANVNKMTFYKYHNNKYDALAKAFTSRLNDEYHAEIAKRQDEIKNMDMDEANYQALLFVMEFIEKYHVQFSHLVSSSGDLPKDVVFSALFANYRPYFSSLIGKEVTKENEYLIHFVFGAFRSIYECQMQNLAKNSNDGSPRQNAEEACRIIAKTFSLVERALLEKKDKSDSATAT